MPVCIDCSATENKLAPWGAATATTVFVSYAHGDGDLRGRRWVRRGAQGGKLNVFISYSRDDVAFGRSARCVAASRGLRDDPSIVAACPGGED